MAENLPWLFGAFTLGWTLIFLYLASISIREVRLRRRLTALQELIAEQHSRAKS